MRALPAELAPVVAVIERRLGLRCSGSRAGSIADEVRQAMAGAGVDDPAVYARRVERDPLALEDLAGALRVDETYFLREAEQLRVLSERVLPSFGSRLTRELPLRVWSAGCASGEEAYSLAITLEAVGFAGRAEILATDRSTTALAAAERGVYGSWSLRAVSASGRERYFASADEGAVVVDRLRAGVTFRRHDLITDPYPNEQDIVVCRNVLLYLTPEHGAAVVERLTAALAPGGWLVLGSADPHHHAGTLLEAVRTSAGSLYRKPCRATRTPPGPDARRTAGRRQPARPATGAPPPRRAPGAGPPAAEKTVHRSHDVVTRSAPTGAGDLLASLRHCEQALAQRPLDATLHGLHATLLLEAGEPVRALRAATGALFLTPDMAAVHLVAARVHLALDDPGSAVRAFRNARTLLQQLPADASVAPSDAPAGRLLEVALAGERQALRGSGR